MGENSSEFVLLGPLAAAQNQAAICAYAEVQDLVRFCLYNM